MKRVSEVYTAEYIPYDFDNYLPPDVWQAIFSIALTSLQEIVQVSTKWRDMAYDPAFYKAIVPIQRFGSEDWEKYIGTVEKETFLPFCAFKDIAKGEGYLTWVPESVLITKKDGTVEEIVLDNALKLKELATNLKTGHKAHFHPFTLLDGIDKLKIQAKSHWVWIRQELIPIDENIYSLMDVLVSGFMEKIRSNKNLFEVKSEKDWPQPAKFIQLRENKELSTAVQFSVEGLYFGQGWQFGCKSPLFILRTSPGR